MSDRDVWGALTQGLPEAAFIGLCLGLILLAYIFIATAVARWLRRNDRDQHND